MTAGAGVPPELLRRVLEALRDDATLRNISATFEARSNATKRLAQACTAALAAASGPDAGETDGFKDAVHDLELAAADEALTRTSIKGDDEQRQKGIEGHKRALKLLGEARQALLAYQPAPASAQPAGVAEATALAQGVPVEQVRYPEPETTAGTGAAPEERGHKWSDAAVVAAMHAPPCKGETLSNPRVCGYCTRKMLSAALAVDFPALVSAAPEERDGERAREMAHRRVIHELQAAIRAGAEALTLPVQLALDDYCRAVRAELAGDLAQRERAAREAGRADAGEVIGVGQLMTDPVMTSPAIVSLAVDARIGLRRGDTVQLVRVVPWRGKEEG